MALKGTKITANNLSGNRSPYTGVYPHPLGKKKWKATTYRMGQVISLGTYVTDVEAARVVDNANFYLRHFAGKGKQLVRNFNFPKEWEHEVTRPKIHEKVTEIRNMLRGRFPDQEAYKAMDLAERTVAIQQGFIETQIEMMKGTGERLVSACRAQFQRIKELETKLTDQQVEIERLRELLDAKDTMGGRTHLVMRPVGQSSHGELVPAVSAGLDAGI